MSKIKGIFIDFKGLTDKEEIDLWDNLWVFAHQNLPKEKDLKISLIHKEKKKEGDMWWIKNMKMLKQW